MERSDYARYLASDAWRKTRQEAQTYYRWECAICGHAFRKRNDFIEVHHLPEGYKHLGNERMQDLRLLCSTHHTKGQITASAIAMRRRSYRMAKLLDKLLLLPLKVMAWVFRNARRPSA